MALKIDEVMELSLDDYIKISKPSNGGGVSTNNCNSSKNSNCSNDAKFGRRKGNIDDEEDDEDMLNIHDETKEEPLGKSTPLNGSGVDTGIWKGPESSIAYIDCYDQQNDLREKLRNNSNSNNYKNTNNHGQTTSVQYRLHAPNNAANRPHGIPTLLPLDAYVRQNKNHSGGGQQNGYRRNRNGNRGDNRGGNRGGNRSYNNGGGGNNNNYGGSVVSGRIQRNRQQDISSKNFRFAVNRNETNLNDTLLSQTTARNMVIETPSQYINLEPSAQLNSQFQVPQATRINNINNGNQSIPIGNLTPQAQAALNLNSSNQNVSNNNDSLKSLLGFQGNVSGDMMPVFASRLLDFIQNGSQAPVHKPMYDMKIQKDIHEIQNKPLLYKCNGGEVVSSDGAGVNCKIIPRTSGVSLNCRFA